jgi:NhaP-type Na+/H+ or K+/H+ antiporter
LNVESGLNDGLVVPVVAICTSLLLESSRSTASWIGFVAQQIGFGAFAGALVGFGGIGILRRARSAGWSDARYEQIATFALPVVAFCGSAALGGNGFIAAFSAGLAFGSGGLRRRIRSDEPDMAGSEEAEHLAEFTEDAAELLGAVTFFVFGNLFVGDALGEFSPAVIIAALASLTIVRMIPVAIALSGSGLDTAAKGFIGWFGPRGLASIVFGILLLEELEERSETADQLVGVISLTVTLSVFLHGATAAYGARRYGAHSAHVEPMHEPVAMPRMRGGRQPQP